MNNLLCGSMLVISTTVSIAFGGTVAVLPIQSSLFSREETEGITEKLTLEIVNAGTFTVVERSQIAEILKEQGLLMSGCTSTECAVRVGELLSAEYMITGRIDKVASEYLVTLRMIDVGSGTVRRMVEHRVSASMQTLLATGLKGAAEQISATHSDLVAKGDIAYKSSDYLSAIGSFTAAIALDSLEGTDYLKRAQAYRAQQWKEYNDTATALDKRRQSSQTYSFLITRDIQKAIQVKPDLAEAYLFRASTNYGDRTAALSDLAMAIKLAPRFDLYPIKWTRVKLHSLD